jgi:hypothetical protein
MADFMTDALQHFAAGLTFSLADYVVHKARTDKKERMANNEDLLQAMKYILDANRIDTTSEVNPTETKKGESKDKGTAKISTSLESIAESGTKPSKDSVQYGQNIQLVKDYFINHGIIRSEVSRWERIKARGRSLVNTDEKINPLRWRGRLLLATTLEVADTVGGTLYYQFVLKESPGASVWHNLYQIPTMYLGLFTGKGITKAFNGMTTLFGKEGEQIKTIEQIHKKTGLLDYVIDYEPSSQVQTQLADTKFGKVALQLTTRGERLYHKLEKTVDGIANYRANRRASDAERQQHSQDRFNEITKDR